MRGFKPRIVITIATKSSLYEFSIVEGRETASGKPAKPPTDAQYEIVHKAIRDLCAISKTETKKPKKKTK